MMKSRPRSVDERVYVIGGIRARKIALTQGKWTLVDESDYCDLMRFAWFAVRMGRRHYYAERRAIVDGKQVHILMHRVITQCPDELEPDHIDGDGLNNMRNNLRIATHAENMRNQGAHRGRYKGVDFSKACGRWQARIRRGNILLTLGYYDCEEDAALAYDIAARRLHGEFAKFNFPQIFGSVSDDAKQ